MQRAGDELFILFGLQLKLGWHFVKLKSSLKISRSATGDYSTKSSGHLYFTQTLTAILAH